MTPTSVFTSTWRRRCLSVRTSVCGSLWMPTQTPLTKILVLSGITLGEMSSSGSVVHSSKNSSTGADCEPTVMYAISARFLTSPTAWPSGVSAGQNMPHRLLCSWRGLASLPSRPMGELARRRCDSDDAYVRRLSTCDTPAFMPCVPCCPQLPVASEYLSPRVMVCVLTAHGTLTSLPASTHFCTCMRRSFVSLRKSSRKRLASSGPPRSSRLLA
mmetsp:Transcript_26840/g.79698  ORF Transcript_26840/g.79698 Transcript_26840/m.79698 type:complete len:215 (-) Transcript_26840:1250-1894(-)